MKIITKTFLIGIPVILISVYIFAHEPPLFGGNGDTSFEDLENITKEDGLYKIDMGEWNEVEIKDQDTPEVKLKKWGDETFIKLSYPDFEPQEKLFGGTALSEQDEGKLKWVNGDKEVHLYALASTEQMTEGGFEFEIILKKKPKTNKIVLDIESQGLKFLYQPSLHPDHPTWNIDELGGREDRPENIVGSYAVYHDTKQPLHRSKEEAEKYKVGKAFHIYRPKITDAIGNWDWSEQRFDIDENGIGQQIITISQDFLDNAVYPIRHAGGDTFGYTEEGDSNYGLKDYLYTYLFTGAEGTATHLSFWSNTASAEDWTWVIYDGSNRIDYTASGTKTDDDWNERAVVVGATVSATTYYMGFFSSYLSGGMAYDSDAGQTNWYQSVAYVDPPPATWTKSQSGQTRKFSIYCTYTPEAPPAVEAVDGTVIQNWEE